MRRPVLGHTPDCSSPAPNTRCNKPKAVPTLLALRRQPLRFRDCISSPPRRSDCFLCKAKRRSTAHKKPKEPTPQVPDVSDEDADLVVGTATSASGEEAISTEGHTSAEQQSRAEPEVQQQIAPAKLQPQPAQQQSWTLPALIGVAAVAAIGLVYLFRNQLKRAPGPPGFGALQKGVETVRLQREASAHLNTMVDELRNSQNANLSAKNLGNEGTAYVVEGLAFNDRCLAADLGKNGMGPEGVAALCQALENNRTLQTLSLDTNSVGDEGASSLAQYLSTNATIRKLNLNGNAIGDTGARVLAEVLKMNTTLVKLELSANVIDYDGAKALAEALAENTSLTSLALSDNYLGPLGAGVLANAMRQNTGLRELFVKGNELGDEGIKSLCSAFAAREAPISVLDLGNNNMTEESAPELAALLKRNHLKELNIYMNDVGDGGILKMAEALKGDKRLAILDVGGNNIGPDGIAALGSALSGHKALKTLELGYNPIGEVGARSLANILKYELAVETLRLGWCKLGSGDGAAAVADLLLFNASLVTVDLRGNGFGDSGAIHIARALRELTTEKLAELDLGYNEIKDDGACQLALALKANPERAPKELKANANYISRFGQTALNDALDMVYETSGGREITIML